MLRLLLTTLFKFLIIGSVFSQEIHLVKSFADNQYFAGNYKSALKEYQRVLYFDQQKEYEDIYYKIATIYYSLHEYEEALKYFDFAHNTTEDDSLKFELVLKKGLCNLKQENYFAALYELFDLPDTDIDILNKKKHVFLGVSYFGLEDFEKSKDNFSQVLDSTGIQQINLLFTDFVAYRKKFAPEKVELMSKLLPGLGQIYTGEYLNGLNSTLLLSGVFYISLRTALNYGFIDGMLILSSWFYRYYSGGHTNANILARDKIENEKSDVYNQILHIIEK